ncbi:diguanylate cyclase [Candidatus Bipolaricaulota bacterium]|nr:diguanylate cyclase [Candidatus Bipolaricaulota bacterium]
MDSTTAPSQRNRRPHWLIRLRSWIRYGTSLRQKLVVLVLAIALLVVGALYWFASISLRGSIASIYEQRARSVAAVISKSIQEKEYILYYSDELDADIGRLLDRYESVVGITVIGASARGFLVVASTDPTVIGALASEEDQDRFGILRSVEVTRARVADTSYLRAVHPIFSGPDLIGVVEVDMSLAEQARYITRLSLRFGAASIAGFLLLGGLLYIALMRIATRPIGRLADAMDLVAQHRYDVEVAVPFRRIPGTRQRDEVSQLIDGFNLMTKVIHSHEQELMKLVVLDELTGAYTIEHLEAELDRELNKTRRYRHPTSLLVIDVDGLADRAENERNDVLVRTSSFLVGNLRNVDVLFRVGELRFASLLPETPPTGASVAAERLQKMTPDITAQFGFPMTVRVTHMGWDEEGAPATAQILARLAGPFEDLRG